MRSNSASPTTSIDPPNSNTVSIAHWHVIRIVGRAPLGSSAACCFACGSSGSRPIAVSVGNKQANPHPARGGQSRSAPLRYCPEWVERVSWVSAQEFSAQLGDGLLRIQDFGNPRIRLADCVKDAHHMHHARAGIQTSDVIQCERRARTNGGRADEFSQTVETG